MPRILVSGVLVPRVSVPLCGMPRVRVFNFGSDLKSTVLVQCLYPEFWWPGFCSRVFMSRVLVQSFDVQSFGAQSWDPHVGMATIDYGSCEQDS